MITEDLTAFFSDLAVTATIVTGTSTATESVLFDTPSRSVLSGMAMIDEPAITFPATVSVQRGSTVTIGGTAYTVRTVEKIDDGAIARATLQAA